MNEHKIRITVAIIVGLFLACFGAFIYSDFQFRGLTLSANVFGIMNDGTLRNFSNGLYTLFRSGFSANIFTQYSDNMAELGFFGVFFNEDLWPIILTWFSTGFVVGIIVKGFKYSFIINGIIFLSLFLLWLIAGLFAGQDITGIFSSGILNTLGEFATVLIFLILGATAGGLTSGPNYTG